MAEALDLLILGSGSTAFAAAIRATDLGARVAMVERRTLGGTCANRGCLPSKNLIEAARIVHEAAHPRYAGLAPAEVAVDFAALSPRRTRSSTPTGPRSTQAWPTGSPSSR
jgi:mercuric reductase